MTEFRPRPNAAPDLSAFDRQWASDLEQFAQEAVIGLRHQIDDLSRRLRVIDKASAYGAETAHELRRVQRLQDRARLLQKAANRQARIADRRKVA